MLFSYQKYAEFNINIFDYSDVFEFLIAPFSDFDILLFSVTSLGFVFIAMRFDMFWKKKHPRSYSKASLGLERKNGYNTFRCIIFGIGFILYLYLSADFYGKFVKKEIQGQDPISIRYADNEIKKGKLIGKTTDIIFLLEGNEVAAIPITSLVKKIEIK